MVEQLGLEIILSFLVKILLLISGIISALVSLQVEELSITVVPTLTKRGAHSKATHPPRLTPNHYTKSYPLEQVGILCQIIE